MNIQCSNLNMSNQHVKLQSKISKHTSAIGMPGLGTTINSLTQFNFPGADRPLWIIVTIGMGTLISLGIYIKSKFDNYF